MANHVSAIKRNKQSAERQLINQMNRHKLKTQVKKLKTAVEAGQADEARALLPKTFSLLDKSVQKGVLKANTARRYKSRINRSVNSVTAA
jgi:small subunit ribosomal protein S20